MCTRSKFLLLLPFLGLTFGSNEKVISYDTKMPCNETVLKKLDECWNNLPSANVIKMPSSPGEIENACRIFFNGMDCVNSWSRTCLSKEGQEKIEGSTFGATKMYELLCTDTKFREAYLKHANCYQKISLHWEYCNTKFTNTIKTVDHARDTLSLCCIRLKYKECVSDATKFYCTDVANTFLESITESLMHSPLPSYHSSQCNNVDRRNCSKRSSGAFPTKMFNKSHLTISVIMLNAFKWIFAIFVFFKCVDMCEFMR